MSEGFLILLADDQAESRHTLRYLLEQLAFEVLEAEDGPGVLALAETDDPDLILLGADLPGLDGLETCRELKGLSPMLAKIPVILIVDDLRADELVEARAAGVEDFLVRPLDEQDGLEQRLLMHLASSRETRTMMRVSQQRGLSTARSARNRMLDDFEPQDHGRLGISSVTQHSEGLGGDVLGFIPLGAHHAAVFVLGVEGRDLGPTLLTATLHALLTLPPEQGLLQLSADEEGDFLEPAAVLELLDTAFPAEKTRWRHRFTYVQLDSRSGEFRFASRGAPPPLHCCPGQASVVALGSPTAVAEKPVFGAGTLAPGDLLVVPGSFLGALAGQGGPSFTGSPLESALRDALADEPDDALDDSSAAILFALDRHLAGGVAPVDVALALVGFGAER